MATAWAVIRHLGLEGYLELTRLTLDNADRMRAAIAATDGVRVLGDSRFHLVALTADLAADPPLDVFALGEALSARGWFHDRQGPPDTLHATVSNSNAGVIDRYVADLAACVAEVKDRRAGDRSTDYATLE
jgi:glutamate/tyrosine decarboxylase-like PLP-dependent enzyme